MSKGPAPVPIPSVADMSEEDALAALGRFLVTTERRDDEVVARGIAIETVPPAGTEQAPDTGVTLVISDGPAPVGVPNVVGAGYDDAAKQLQGRGFTVVRAPDEFGTAGDKDKVIRTDPPAGTLVPRGSSVTVVVSKGPETVKVPNFRDATYEQADTMLKQLGLDHGPPGLRAWPQSAGPGTRRRRHRQQGQSGHPGVHRDLTVRRSAAGAVQCRGFRRKGSRTWVHSTDALPSSPAPDAASAASTRCSSPSEGAKVVVNDLGGDIDGERRRPGPGRSRWSTRSRPWAARPSPTSTTWPTGTAPSASSRPPSTPSATCTCS